MSLQLLFDHLDDLVRTPEDVARLEAAILDLAVRGKLTRQGDGDEPLSSITIAPVENGSFAIPDSWRWHRLVDIAAYGTSRSASANELAENTWVLDLEDIEKTTSRLLQRVPLSERPFKSSKAVFLKGDVLYGKLRPYLDKVLVAEESGVCSSEIVPIRPDGNVDPHYLRIVLKSPYHLNYVANLTYGVKMPRLGTKDAHNALIPLPPLAEQRRIVAKVDELLAQTRALAANLRRAQGEIVTANQAALHRLASAEDGASLQAAWHTLAGSFDLLYDDPRPLAALRQAILQLAVRGKLVRQEEGDEPAEELVRRIEARRLPLFGDKGLVASAAVDSVDDLPSGWVYVQLDRIAAIGTGSTPNRGEPKYYRDGDIPWITSAVTGSPHISQPSEYITELALKETNCKIFPKHTLIVALYGQGKTRGQVSELLIEAATNQACAAIIFAGFSEELQPYIKLFFQKYYEELRSLAEGGAQPNLNVGKIKRTSIPLPPLAEQRRIVAKVDELLALCDALEQGLGQAAAAQRAALEAVLARV